MLSITETLKGLNEYTGVTLMLSSIAFAVNEWIKFRNVKKIGRIKFKAENIDIKTLEKEEELYLILSKFCLLDNSPESLCITTYDTIREYLIQNNLFLREELHKIGSSFADYIIEDVSNGNKDLQKQENMLKKFKKTYRS